MCVKKHELDCQFILGQNEQLKPYGWTIHENAPWILAIVTRSGNRFCKRRDFFRKFGMSLPTPHRREEECLSAV